MQHVLKEMEEQTGLKTNKLKSFIVFILNTPNHIGTEITNLTDLKEKKELRKYLGVSLDARGDVTP